MLVASLLMLAQVETRYTPPAYFAVVVLALLILGAIGWLVSAVLGFSRARAFGPSIRWFALASVCLLIYHLQFLVLAIGLIQNDAELVLGLGAFFNLFVVLASICAIVGLVRLTNPR